MSGSSIPVPRSSCPVAASLDILGDRWTLVILRDLLVGGIVHFADFAVDEGIATNTLTERLKRLRKAGLVERVRDPDDGRRWIYVPKSPAIELIPVLIDLMVWGSKHTAVDVPSGTVPEPDQRDAMIEHVTAQATLLMAR